MNHSCKKYISIAAFWLMPLLILSLRSTSVGQLNVDVSNAPLTSLPIGDLDFKTFGSNNWFFTININYPGSHPHVQLSAEIDIILADGTNLSNPAASLLTNPFEVDNQRTITNLDIGKNSDIKTQDFHFNQDAKDKLQNLALGIGKLPAGTYTFHLMISDQDVAGVSATKDVVLNLQNISRMDLILPQDNSQDPTVLPLFQWRYDGSNVQLFVYEKRSGSQSREDAASGVPQLQVQSGAPGFPSGSTSFQYPVVGARPLERGKTYVWKVIGLTGGTGGVGQQVPSELWEFTVQNTNNPDNNSPDLSLSFLTGLGEDILNQLSSGNLKPTGLLYIDGQLVSAADGEAILNDLKANPDKIIEIQIVQ
ncbi:MAG: hypothetical protein ACHQQQ_10860 [Bacteroidota bacterium]